MTRNTLIHAQFIRGDETVDSWIAHVPRIGDQVVVERASVESEIVTMTVTHVTWWCQEVDAAGDPLVRIYGKVDVE